jgi:hypothetical protein
MLLTTVVWLTNDLVRSGAMITLRSLGAQKSREETNRKAEGAPNPIETPTEKLGGTGAQPM